MPTAPISDPLSANLPAREPVAPERLADHARRDHILAAAERAFVRYGFHAATMTQVADEAGMSAGNLYRYFPSKEAIVEGLCSPIRSSASGKFARARRAAGFENGHARGLREHVLGCRAEKARMILEIWRRGRPQPARRRDDRGRSTPR